MKDDSPLKTLTGYNPEGRIGVFTTAGAYGYTLPSLQPKIKEPPITYTDFPSQYVDMNLDQSQRLSNLLMRHLYRWRCVRSSLSAAITQVLYGVAGKDLDVTIDASASSDYIQIDPVAGTVTIKGLPSGTFESTNQFYT